jgi:hypothetical protein
MKKLRVRQYSFKQQAEINCKTRFYALLLQTLMILSQKLHCIFLPVVWVHFQQRECFSCLKTLRGRQYSLKQQTQFKLQNKVLAPLASNMNDSLTEATLHLPFNCMGHFHKGNVSHS